MANLKLAPGVVTGNALKELFAYCKEVDCALPAVNVIGSSTANAALAAAKEAKAPIIIQLSHTGSQFFAGKTLDNSQQQASIAGSISGALHVRTLAKAYGVPVVLHTDHCAKKLLPWVDGVIAAGEEYFAKHGEPLFSSHMLDLSEQSLPHAHRQDEHDAGDRARRHRRRGGRRRQLRRLPRQALHPAVGRAAGV